jgi:hypothetical protein
VRSRCHHGSLSLSPETQIRGAPMHRIAALLLALFACAEREGKAPAPPDPPVTATETQGAAIPPTMWAELPGEWIRLVPGKRDFASTDSMWLIGPDTLRVITRLDVSSVSPDRTVLHDEIVVCTEDKVRIIASTDLEVGKPARTTQWKGFEAGWDSASSLGPSRLQQIRAVCQLARAAGLLPD